MTEKDPRIKLGVGLIVRRLRREWQHTHTLEASLAYFERAVEFAEGRPQGCPGCGETETLKSIRRNALDLALVPVTSATVHPTAEICVGCGLSYSPLYREHALAGYRHLQAVKEDRECARCLHPQHKNRVCNYTPSKPGDRVSISPCACGEIVLGATGAVAL